MKHEANQSANADAGRGLSEGLGPTVPERATVSLTLADLQGLAVTASRNDTHHAFQAVALEWCGKAQAEIQRLRFEVAAERERFRAALLDEASQWTGDFRMPVHKGLCDAAKRAGVPLTLDECYQAAKRA